MQNRSILLIIGGGIAAYKNLELIRLLRREGAEVRCVLGNGGAQFVTPLSLAGLSGNTVHTDLFDPEAEIGHIALSRQADLLVVCPATADLAAKAAGGQAMDLAGAVLLASAVPVLMVPAMNVRMWEHPATRRNFEQLRRDGVIVMEPDCGEMACGEFGAGRLPEADSILEQIRVLLKQTDSSGTKDGLLSGKRAIVTAGPTREQLDPVRFLSSESSGRQGFALASALRSEGAEVLLIAGPTAIPPPSGLQVRPVQTALEMLEEAQAALPADIFVAAAAVSDWRPAQRSEQKRKRKGQGSVVSESLELIENPDIVRHIATHRKHRPSLVVGFAAETEKLELHARAKLLSKGCDWIVANEAEAAGEEYNRIQLLTRHEHECWPRMSKTALARKLVQRMGQELQGTELAPSATGESL